MEKTLFEKIVSREIPADIWFEDEISLVFLDINPISTGHSLLISKHPYTWVQDVPPSLLGEIMQNVPVLISKLITSTKCDYVQIAVMGLDVPHFHVHLIPRKFGDNHNELYANGNIQFHKDKLIKELLQN